VDEVSIDSLPHAAPVAATESEMATTIVLTTRQQERQLLALLEAAPTMPFAPLIAHVLPQLPLESDADLRSADRSPLDLQVPGSRGGVTVADQLRRVFETTLTPTYFPRDCSPTGESL
jgi:hypothetical protein